ncbi:MAG: dTDP-4-dehydrorhamnose 3,5-epimerase family protein [Actinomycetota bacterium]
MTKVSATGLAGVHLVSLEPHDDPRGSLTEVFRREWLPESREMVQANLSRSQPNVLRGLHFHLRQADYWCFVSGIAFVGLFDLRDDSPTRGHKAEIAIDADRERTGLYIPSGVAHGFCALSEVRLLYFVDAYYTGEDEHGLAWNDPDVGIDWPVADPVLSDRDRANPPLAHVATSAPPHPG